MFALGLHGNTRKSLILTNVKVEKIWFSSNLKQGLLNDFDLFYDINGGNLFFSLQWRVEDAL